MKNNIVLFLLFSAFFLISCEEVVDVNLDSAAPKLVVDASIKWVKGTDGTDQRIKLTTTAPYFDQVIPVVSNANVFITDANNQTFNFIEFEDSGEYICTDFIPVLNTSYTLTIITNGETYVATEIFKPVPPIDKVEQITLDGFAGEYTQVRAFYTDNAATDDFYLFSFKPDYKVIPSYQVSEDEFYQGNQIFGLYFSEDFEVGDSLEIYVYGISQRYFNYMNKLISISGSGGGAPFQSPPATVLGNIVNTTNKNNFALGYFNLSEVDYRNYILTDE